MQGSTYRQPNAALHSTHPSNNHIDNQQALLQQALLSHQSAGPSFVAQPVITQQQLLHLLAAQQQQQQQLLALFAAQQATPPSFPVYSPALQPGSYAQPSHRALYFADPLQQLQADTLAQQWQQALAQLRAPAVTPLQHANPPGVAPVLVDETGSMLLQPASMEAAQQLPPATDLHPASFPGGESARAHDLAPAAPADVPSCPQTGLQMHPAPVNHPADAAQQQPAVLEPVQGHARQQPNFFAALWDGMRSAGAAALHRQQPRAAALPPPMPQVPHPPAGTLCSIPPTKYLI